MARKISEISGMPNPSGALNGWQSTITLKIITHTIDDFCPKETERLISFKGTVQPLSTEALKLKAEGERSWQWLQIHVHTGENDLNTSDIIEYNGKNYKIMEQYDYSLNGFMEYHAIEDYKDG